MLIRRALIGAIVVFLGIAAIPAVIARADGSVLCAARKASKCATLIIHVYGSGGPAPGSKRTALETWKVRVEKLGPQDEVLGSIVTRKHRLRIAPGRYKATSGGEGTFGKKVVVVRAGQAREITLEAKIR